MKKLGNGAQISGAETARRLVVQRRMSGAEMALGDWNLETELLTERSLSFDHLQRIFSIFDDR